MTMTIFWSLKKKHWSLFHREQPWVWVLADTSGRCLSGGTAELNHLLWWVMLNISLTHHFLPRDRKWMGQALVVSVVLRFPPFHVHAHKSSACNARTSAALRLIRRMLTPRITLAVFVLFIPTSRCVTKDGTVHIYAFLCDVFWCSWCVCKMCLAAGISNYCTLFICCIWTDLESDLHKYNVIPTTKAHQE